MALLKLRRNNDPRLFAFSITFAYTYIWGILLQKPAKRMEKAGDILSKCHPVEEYIPFAIPFLAIEGFQLTGDSSKGTVNVKFHVTSNFYLLNGKLTVFRGNGLDPVIVGYGIPSSICFSAHSATNFAIRFEEMESGKTYSGELVAEDISGNIVTKTVEFTAY